MMMNRKISIDKPSLLEQEIARIVDRAIKNSKVELAAEDIQIIAQDIMPDINKMISKKVKLHFLAIGQHIVEKFSMGE